VLRDVSTTALLRKVTIWSFGLSCDYIILMSPFTIGAHKHYELTVLGFSSSNSHIVHSGPLCDGLALDSVW
jgi:hypothetical protein